MAEYSREQRNKLSRAIANSGLGSKQLKAFVDNRYSNFMQLRPNKIVLSSAQKHYNDGWGDKYGIKNNDSLKTRVSNDVTGNGGIELGWYDAPEAEQPYPPDGTRKQKYCKIDYRDGREYNSTAIYHCGPSGGAKWRKV